MSQPPILALTHLQGFRWVPAINNLPVFLRVPTLLLTLLVLGMGLWALGLPGNRVINALIAVAFMLSTLALWIIMAIASQRELTTLVDGGDRYAQHMAPSRTTAWLEFSLGVLAGLVNLALLQMVSLSSEQTVPGVLLNAEIANSDALLYAFSMTAFIIICWGGVVTVHLLFFLFRHYHAYMDLARNITVDLFDLEPCQIVSRPLLRYWFLVVLVTALYMVLSRFSTNAEVFATAIVLPLLGVLLILSWLFILPVWVVRERIRGLKLQELDRVRQAIAGDRTTLERTHLKGRADEFATPDLIYYLDHVARLWEWPIQQEMQRIAIYTLIPPFAWIMAALVERLLDNML